MSMRYIVAQLGARCHYAVARILNEQGALERMYTDICATQGWPRLTRWAPRAALPGVLRRLCDRVPYGMSHQKVTAFTSLGWAYAVRRSRAPACSLEPHLWAGREFCRQVLQAGLGAAGGVYTFNSAALELLEHASEHGVRSVLEQTGVPREIERQIMHQEHEKFPGWEATRSDEESWEQMCHREREERSLADLILCGSQFTVEGINRCDEPVGRCAVVPYGLSRWPTNRTRARRRGALRVLCAGGVRLQKGVAYAWQAARRLRAEVEVRMVGPIGLAERGVNEIRRDLELTGPVPRSQMAGHYAWADVLLFPTVCDGFGLVQVEALAEGIPVIATDHAGEVVRDGIDGYVVPAGDVEAICDRLGRLVDDDDLRRAMSRSAQERMKEFTIEAYGRRLMETLRHATQATSSRNRWTTSFC